jgi:hypothetical protein
MLAGVIDIASGNLALAMFQIQTAPPPRMVSWRT